MTRSAHGKNYNIHYEAKVIAWFRDNGLRDVVSRRLPELDQYESMQGKIDMTGKELVPSRVPDGEKYEY